MAITLFLGRHFRAALLLAAAAGHAASGDSFRAASPASHSIESSTTESRHHMQWNDGGASLIGMGG